MINEIDKILEFVKSNDSHLLEHRRWFHQNPETAYKEIKTGDYILEYLNKLGINKVEKVAKTGIIATINGKHFTKTIACRFNMDALPIEEKTNFKFKSLNKGYSHACGHDYELAWGLLIAKHFSENQPNGNLKLIFQPAEEGHFDVDGVFSLHIEPKLPIGTVSITEGEVTGAAYDFEIELQGKMGYAAKPEDAINPINYASELIVK
jgi:amidohydrolase